MVALLGPPWVAPAWAVPVDCYGERITSPDGAEVSGYFSSVGVDGRWAVIGERGDDNGGTSNAGAGYIYEFDSGWVYAHQIEPEGSSSDLEEAHFGESVSIDGDWLALAGPGWDNLKGAVQLFKRNTSTDVWEHQVTLEAEMPQQSQNFGGTASLHHGVSNDGRLVAVGAPGFEDTYGGQGAAYVYTYNSGTSQWDETLLIASSPEANQNFGAAVAIDGNVLVVGAPGGDVDSHEDAGLAHVYRNISGTWTFEQTLEADDPEVGDQFGWSVAISGNYIIVGSQAAGSDGFATIFRYNTGTSDWDFDQELTEDDIVGYGFSVAIDAGRAVVGDTSFVNPEDSSSSGGAFVYQRNGSGDWVAEMRLFPICAEADSSDQFGGSVSISGDDVFVGALRDTATQTNEGTVYIFEDVPTCSGETECP